jgi:hypothetical protein
MNMMQSELCRHSINFVKIEGICSTRLVGGAKMSTIERIILQNNRMDETRRIDRLAPPPEQKKDIMRIILTKKIGIISSTAPFRLRICRLWSQILPICLLLE